MTNISLERFESFWSEKAESHTKIPKSRNGPQSVTKTDVALRGKRLAHANLNSRHLEAEPQSLIKLILH